MLALLAPLIGIFGSVLPSVVRIFEKKQDYAHELALEQARITGSIEAAKHEVVLENIKADVSEGESLRSHDAALDGGVFFNALRASVRPVITYVFFALFVSVKVAAAYTMIKNGQSIPNMLDVVWDQETMALFATIMGFWFGSRAIESMSKRMNTNEIKATKKAGA